MGWTVRSLFRAIIGYLYSSDCNFWITWLILKNLNFYESWLDYKSFSLLTSKYFFSRKNHSKCYTSFRLTLNCNYSKGYFATFYVIWSRFYSNKSVCVYIDNHKCLWLIGLFLTLIFILKFHLVHLHMKQIPC